MSDLIAEKQFPSAPAARRPNPTHYRPQGLTKAAPAISEDVVPATEKSKSSDPLRLSPYAHMLLGTVAQGELDLHLAGEFGPGKTPAVIRAIDSLHPGLGAVIQCNLREVTGQMARELVEKHLPKGYEHIFLPEIPFQITKRQAEIIQAGIDNPRFAALARQAGFRSLDDCVKRMVLDPQFTFNLGGKNYTVEDIFSGQSLPEQTKPMCDFLGSVFSYYIFNLDSNVTANTPLAQVKELVTSIIARPDLLVFSVKPNSFAAHHLRKIHTEFMENGTFFGRTPLLDLKNLDSAQARSLRVTMELLMNALLEQNPDVRLTLIEGKACFHTKAARQKIVRGEKTYDYSPITFDKSRIQPEQVTDIAHTAAALLGGFRNFLRRVYLPSMPRSGARNPAARRIEPTLSQINAALANVLGNTRYLFTRINYPIFDLAAANLPPTKLLESISPRAARRIKPNFAINSVDSLLVLDRLDRLHEYVSRRVTGKLPDKDPEETLFV